MILFQNKDPKTELEGLDKALEILQERYNRKAITIEQFSKQCQDIAKKRSKYKKKLEKQERNSY